MSLDQQFKGKAICLFIRANLVLGLLVVAVCMYLMVTGEYASIQARQEGDAMLTRYAVGGLVYTVIFWYLCLFGKPFLLPSRQPRS